MELHSRHLWKIEKELLNRDEERVDHVTSFDLQPAEYYVKDIFLVTS